MPRKASRSLCAAATLERCLHVVAGRPRGSGGLLDSSVLMGCFMGNSFHVNVIAAVIHDLKHSNFPQSWVGGPSSDGIDAMLCVDGLP
jgi:hypothetical protein